jgi:hypothetical protein
MNAKRRHPPAKPKREPPGADQLGPYAHALSEHLGRRRVVGWRMVARCLERWRFPIAAHLARVLAKKQSQYVFRSKAPTGAPARVHVTQVRAGPSNRTRGLPRWSPHHPPSDYLDRQRPAATVSALANHGWGDHGVTDHETRTGISPFMSFASATNFG